MLEKPINPNRRRSGKISFLRRKNQNLVEQMNVHVKSTVLNEETKTYVSKFVKNVKDCASLSLYEKTATDIKHISSHTCDHKLCFICNYLRQKKIRRKYSLWFDNNPHFLTILKEKGSTYVEKVITIWQHENKYPEYDIVSRVKFEVMHLLLTVRHTEDGFKGEKFYQKEFRRLFNLMRKKEEWLAWVYGGEFGFEITKKENGYHIHVHSMIFVKKGFRNRNKIYRMIFELWNKATVDKTNDKVKFTEKELTAIKKNCGNIPNWETPEDFVKRLKPNGATRIRLEGLYIHDENGKKIYVTEYTGQNVMKSLLEIISYHFEPYAFDKENDEFDVPLMVELLPYMFNLRIYDRFGILHSESPLAMRNNSLLSDLEEALESKEELEGGIEKAKENSNFSIINPVYAYHPKHDDYRITINEKGHDLRIDLSASNTKDAVEEMSRLAIMMHSEPTPKESNPMPGNTDFDNHDISSQERADFEDQISDMMGE